MEKILLLTFVFGYLFWTPPSLAENQIDQPIKNLSLVGVIHVAGLKAKGQSVAVLKNLQSGRTMLLRLGDTLLEGDLTVSELGPQQVTLAGGEQHYVLRVEKQEETTLSAEASDSYEAEEGSLSDETENSNVGEIDTTRAKQVGKTPPPRFEPRVLPESTCLGEFCQIK